MQTPDATVYLHSNVQKQPFHMVFFLTDQGYGTQGIDRLVTLGSPHLAPPKVLVYLK